ncbi:alpha-galactosidase [uncultured Eubacterium sp.]|uniref:glycoside hydrolase family 36 protein n=1 Tax=uncultured Eubacterium sp. TaxID=165185 RepID=UPI0015AD60C7|nr:alpha-galactosidase [uncultured Eubacterium sp.]
MQRYSVNFTYKVFGKIKHTSDFNEDIAWRLEQNEQTLRLILLPKTEISSVSFEVKRNYDFASDSRFFANGFQSWSDTREFTVNDKMSGLGLVGKSIVGKKFGLKYVGDYTFCKQAETTGEFHSHGLAYVRNGSRLDFFGSLDERTGFTVIYADMNKNSLCFTKDLEGITISKPYDVLNLYFAQGEYDEVFDLYFDTLGVKCLTNEKIKGYTSWYNYYQKISEDIILRDLRSMSAEKKYVNTFQIDDGYQTAVGDWLSIDSKKFPHGMKPIADEIHNDGFKAGIWLAPFGAQFNSAVAKEHPDWLIKDEKGKPIPVGANWGGFYALDIYNEEAASYIRRVFDTIINDWGFDMVKLDFLYACSIVPMYNKTRGQIACEAMDFLRECVGDKLILGCGVWMLPCFGKVDYMRIGADMALSWKHTLLRKMMHREDVSTPNAIHNSVYRRCFNGRAFLCDPDVFLLRRTNIGFSVEQQELLAKFIKLFGGVLFMSDNLGDYDERQLGTFRDTLTDDAELLAVNEGGDTIFVDYVQNGEEHTLKFCVTDGTIY